MTHGSTPAMASKRSFLITRSRALSPMLVSFLCPVSAVTRPLLNLRLIGMAPTGQSSRASLCNTVVKRAGISHRKMRRSMENGTGRPSLLPHTTANSRGNRDMYSVKGVVKPSRIFSQALAGSRSPDNRGLAVYALQNEQKNSMLWGGATPFARSETRRCLIRGSLAPWTKRKGVTL